MGNKYMDQAYDLIYKDPDWETEAGEYEMLVGTKLYNSPKVKQEARRALVQLSKVLNRAYGTGASKSQRERLEELSQDPGKEGLLAMAGELFPEPIQESNTSPVVDETGVPEAEHVEVTDTMTNALMRSDRKGAGQIKLEDKSNGDEEIADMQHAIDMANADFVINGEVRKSSDAPSQEGNLREMMTMFYNGAVISGGHGKEGNEGSYKRILKSASQEELRQYGINQQGREAINKLQTEGGDIYDPMKLMNSQGNFGFWTKAFHRIGSFFRKRKQKPEPLGLNHYNEWGIEPSVRESNLAVNDVDELSTDGKMKVKRKHLNWEEGQAYFTYTNNPFNIWRNSVKGKGHQIIAGLSGTSQRLLTVYRSLGANQEQLLNFRLALLGYMLTSKDHSLYEIIEGARSVGVSGKEDMTDAASLYMTIDPLTTDELRQHVAKEKKFPQEHIYLKLLDEYNEKRGGKENGLAEDRELNPGETGINIYTSPAYRNMNAGMQYGRGISDKLQSYYQKHNTNPYLHSTRETVTNPETVKQVGDLLQISSRLSLDYLKEAIRRPKDPMAENDGSHGYVGETYRGEGVLFPGKYKKKDSIININKFLSTSRQTRTAASFYGGVSKPKTPVYIVFHLKGNSGVSIENISWIKGENEVLVAPGSQFRVRDPLHNEDGRNVVELEEVKGPSNYIKGQVEEAEESGTFEEPIRLVSGIESGIENDTFQEESLEQQETEETSENADNATDVSIMTSLQAKLMLSMINKNKLTPEVNLWLMQNDFMSQSIIAGFSKKNQNALDKLEKYTTKAEAQEAYYDSSWKIINEIIQRCIDGEEQQA